MNYSQRFLIKPGAKIKLSDIDPDFTGKHESKKEAIKLIERNNARLRELQELLYAEPRRHEPAGLPRRLFSPANHTGA
jgi:hypothetical protein